MSETIRLTCPVCETRGYECLSCYQLRRWWDREQREGRLP